MNQDQSGADEGSPAVDPWAPEVIGALPGIGWPAIPHAVAAQRLAGLEQLTHSQWLSPEELRRHQFRQLEGLLRHARRGVPFYRRRLTGLDGQLTMETWRGIPLLTRGQVQEAGGALLTQHLPAGHGSVFWTQTSGSTGEPVRVAKTGLTNHFWHLFTLRNHQWHRRALQGKLAAIRYVEGGAAAPYGISSDQWGPSTAGLFRTGPAVSLHIGVNVSDQALWLRRQEPDYLLTYPSNLQALLVYCRERGIVLPRLKDVQTVGEIVSPTLRHLCREAWGVPLVDTYSSQELGHIALQCPHHGHYHIQSENVLVEVLNENAEPCAPGDTGQLVITSLNNFAMPLIRYAIGDHAEVGPPCGCGRGLPVLTRIIGRTRNMLVLPSGERHWPLVGFRRFQAIAPIRQYQIIQKSVRHIVARFVVERPLDPEEEQALAAHLCNSLGHPFEITFEYPDDIPRDKAGKYEEFRSEIP